MICAKFGVLPKQISSLCPSKIPYFEKTFQGGKWETHLTENFLNEFREKGCGVVEEQLEIRPKKNSPSKCVKLF